MSQQNVNIFIKNTLHQSFIYKKIVPLHEKGF